MTEPRPCAGRSSAQLSRRTFERVDRPTLLPQELLLARRGSDRAKELIVFVHGFSGDRSSSWGALLPIVEGRCETRESPTWIRDFNVLFFEYPLVFGEGALGEQTRWLEETITVAQEHCGCTHVYLVAHSLGALLVSRLLADVLDKGEEVLLEDASLAGALRAAVLIAPAFDFGSMVPGDLIGGRFLQRLTRDIETRRKSSPALSTFLRQRVVIVFGMNDEVVISEGRRRLLQTSGETSIYEISEGRPVRTERTVYIPGVLTFWLPTFSHRDIAKIDRAGHPILLLVRSVLRHDATEFRQVILDLTAQLVRDATKQFGIGEMYVHVLNHVIERGLVLKFQKAADERYDQYLALASEENERGNYERAEAALRRAINEAERFGSLDLRLNAALMGIAAFLNQQGRYVEADDAMKRADEVARLAEPNLLRLDAASGAIYLQTSARRLRQAGLFHKASALEERAIITRKTGEGVTVPFQVHVRMDAVGGEPPELPLKRQPLPPGFAFGLQGQDELAISREAKRIFQSDPIFRAQVEPNVPIPDVEKLIDALNELVLIGRRTGDRQIESMALANLGVAHVKVAQTEKAVEYFHEALELKRALADEESVGKLLGDMGAAYVLLGQVEKAIEHFQQAVAIHRRRGDLRAEGKVLTNLGLAYVRRHQQERAIENFQQALTIANQVGDLASAASALSNLAVVFRDDQKEIDYSKRALVIRRKIGDREGEATDLNNLGVAYLRIGQLEDALVHLEEARSIRREMGDRFGEGTQLVNIGLAHVHLGRVDEAIAIFEQALSLSHESRDRRTEGRATGNLGAVYLRSGHTQKAIDYLQRALVISRELGNRENEGLDSNNLGEAHLRLGDIKRAASHLEEALRISRTINSVEMEARALKLLREVGERR